MGILFENTDGNVFKLQNEDKRSSDQVDLNKAYDLFSKSYTASTGHAWDRDKFIGRAHSWKFFGDDNGYVTVREQNSGMVKLVGVAGAPKSIIKGFREMSSSYSGKPIWGAMTLEIGNMVTKLDPKFKIFKMPGGMVGKMLFNTIKSLIPASVFGGANIKGVNPDGTIKFDYADVGEANKVLVGNVEYFNMLKEKIMDYPQIPTMVKNQIVKLI
jgi:hypothetical protein